VNSWRRSLESIEQELKAARARYKDQIAVNSGSDQRHGSGGSEGFHGDISRVVVEYGGGLFK